MLFFRPFGTSVIEFSTKLMKEWKHTPTAPQIFSPYFCSISFKIPGILSTAMYGFRVANHSPSDFICSGFWGGYLQHFIKISTPIISKCHKIRQTNSPCDIRWISLKEIRHENLVFLLCSMGENIGSLEGLFKVSKDIVDYE